MVSTVSLILRTSFVGLLATALLASVGLNAGSGLAVARALYLGANILAFAYVILDRRRGGASLMIAFFFLYFIAIPSTAQTLAGVYPFHASYSSANLVHGYAILCTAQLSYSMAEWWNDTREAKPAPEDARMDASFLRLAVVALLVPCLAIVVVLGDRLFLTRVERGTQSEAGDASWMQLLFVGRSVSLFCAVTCVLLLLKHASSRNRVSFAVVCAATFAVFLLLNYPPGLSRFQLIGSVIAVVSAATSFFKTSRKLAFAGIAPIFLLYLFPAIKALGRGQAIDFAAIASSDPGEYLLGVDFDGFKQTVDTWLYINAGGSLRYGANFAGAALFWIPRSLWSGKPLDSGGFVSERLGYSYTNVSNPLPAEAYISFGYVGIIGVFVLAGIFISRLEARVSRAERWAVVSSGSLLLALVMGFATIILRGSLNGVAPMFSSAFIVYGILLLLANRRSRKELSETKVGPARAGPGTAVTKGRLV